MPIVQLKYFALFREVLGRSDEQREVAVGQTAGQLLETLIAEAPALAALRASSRCLVNRAYVGPDHRLAAGDEVVFIPPVSGGQSSPAPAEPVALPHFRVTEASLNAATVTALVADPGAGAIITFAGVVRDNARGRGVNQLEYEAYAPAAEQMLAQIAAELSERWPVLRCAIWHRIGRLAIGETSVVIALSVPHRQEGFAACAYAIERLNEIVPIWKKEFYADGQTWIGSEAAYQALVDRRPEGT
jgi:molybdopterin synthase catalytic subunit